MRKRQMSWIQCETTKKKKEVKVVEEEEEEEINREEDEEEVEIEEGDELDLKAFLSGESRDFLVTSKGGEFIPIDSLVGKYYVIVCCLSVPFEVDDTDNRIRHCLETLFSEEGEIAVSNSVKLVLVLKVSSLCDFDQFFSTFSLDCLTIPYSDSQSRHNICNRLHNSLHPSLVLHPNGRVLQIHAPFLQTYGAQSFPFTSQHFTNLLKHDQLIIHRIRSLDNPISLPDLLPGCDSLLPIAHPDNPLPISALTSDSIVAIYLCFDGFEPGHFMSHLCRLLETCRGKLSIVLLPVPSGEYCDPRTFYEGITQSALKYTDHSTSSWFSIPYSDTICRSLWRLFHCDLRDELIILPHSGCPGELHGRRIADTYGADAYPFTRDVVIERRARDITSVSLQRLLGESYMTDLHLHDKNVLLYLDYPTFDYDDRRFYKIMRRATQDIKVKYPDSELIFVPLRPITNSKLRRLKLPWQVLPENLRDTVTSYIYMASEYSHAIDPYPAVIAFGKDGLIVSRSAEERLPGWTISDAESLFDNALASEIFDDMMEEMW